MLKLSDSGSSVTIFGLQIKVSPWFQEDLCVFVTVVSELSVKFRSPGVGEDDPVVAADVGFSVVSDLIAVSVVSCSEWQKVIAKSV